MPRLLALLLAAAAAAAADHPVPGADAVVLRVSVAELLGKPRPVVEILGDGRVRHGGKLAKARLTKAELQDLLRFAIETHKFFAYDAAGVDRTLNAREPGPNCGFGFTTTHVFVAVRGKKKEYAVGLLASRATTHADIADLVHLYAIERRIRLEAKLAESGGRKKVTEYLAAANRRLKQRYPGVDAFKIEEFAGLSHLQQMDMILPPGWDPNVRAMVGECATFTRHEPGSITTGTVRTDPKAKPRAAAVVQE